jgi:hypothetical protein
MLAEHKTPDISTDACAMLKYRVEASLFSCCFLTTCRTVKVALRFDRIAASVNSPQSNFTGVCVHIIICNRCRLIPAFSADTRSAYCLQYILTHGKSITLSSGFHVTKG